ncbi:MAG TPA: DNA replication/repair protein RecF [Dehalococcoidia bacterium]|nr:DNA replication/repair protein RecF [Dehalococcoidia bacterium]
MRIRHLRLSDYRNFQRLDVYLAGGVSIFVGDNAQGKSNLLEAVYLLATMRGLRAETDAQLVRRDSLLDGALPAARVVAEGATQEGPLKLEVTVVARPGPQGPIGTKTVKVNGVPRRISDAVGRLTAVLFTAEDMELITGPPSGRRRLLDIALTQVEPAYSSARSRFERVLTQRNHLLKRIREGAAKYDELEFWDEGLARDGGFILQRRANALERLAALAAESHAELGPGDILGIGYQPRLDGERVDLAAASAEEAATAYVSALHRSVGRDVAAGMTLQGPHRDDIAINLNNLAASGFASRAQLRTIALALRLAEARFLTDRRGEPPVLLLDDILSEMDAGRRESVLRALSGSEQILVTGTDWDRFTPEFRAGAALFSVESGLLRPLDPPPARTGDS